jgi:hypothetical protein
MKSLTAIACASILVLLMSRSGLSSSSTTDFLRRQVDSVAGSKGEAGCLLLYSNYNRAAFWPLG